MTWLECNEVMHANVGELRSQGPSRSPKPNTRNISLELGHALTLPNAHSALQTCQHERRTPCKRAVIVRLRHELPRLLIGLQHPASFLRCTSCITDSQAQVTHCELPLAVLLSSTPFYWRFCFWNSPLLLDTVRVLVMRLHGVEELGMGENEFTEL